MASKRTRTASLKPSAHAAGRGTAVAAAPARRIWPWQWWAALGAAFLAAFIIYGPALNGPFVFDDVGLPFAKPHAADAGFRTWLGGVRPMLMLTYWVNFAISGTGTFSYHVLSVLLHFATALVVFFVLRRLLPLAGLRSNPAIMAAFGAAIFLLHPLQTESVAYIAGRSEVVAGLFYFAAWLVFLESFGKPTTLARSAAILLLMGAAVLGKESAATVPAALILTDLYWNRAGIAATVRNRVRLYVPLIVGGVLAVALILRSLTGAASAGFGVNGYRPALYALTQCRSILVYLRMFVLPVGQNGDWKQPLFQSFTDHFVWAYVLGMALLTGTVALTWRKARLLSFGLLFFLVALLPTSSFVPIQDTLAERRVYVPIVGLILAIIWAVDQLRPGKTALVTGAAVLALLSAASFRRAEVWNNDLAFWTNSVAVNPANMRAHMGLGDAYLKSSKCADAEREFRLVENAEGPTQEAVLNRAAAYQCSHEPEKALDALKQIRDPPSAILAQMGYDEALLGRPDDAMSALNRAIVLDPRNAQAWAYRGVLYVAMNNRTAAEADLRKALDLDPESGPAQDGMRMLAGLR